MTLVQCNFLKYITTHNWKPLVGNSQIGVELMFSEYPVSISDPNI